MKETKEKHPQIYGWTKHHDLFSKELIILPICKNAHCYVAVVIKAGDFEEKKLSVLNKDDQQDIIDTASFGKASCI